MRSELLLLLRSPTGKQLDDLGQQQVFCSHGVSYMRGASRIYGPLYDAAFLQLLKDQGERFGRYPRKALTKLIEAKRSRLELLQYLGNPLAAKDAACYVEGPVGF